MSDSFNDIGYAFIEIYVGMAKMVAYWHVKAMGFELKGYRGPETGVDDVVSFLLNKKDINLVITSAANPGNYDVVSFVDRHGNGVKRIAYSVPDVRKAYRRALKHGAIPLTEPKREKDKHGYVEEATLKLLDRKELVLFDNSHYTGLFRPGFEPKRIEGFVPGFDNHFESIDHIAYGLHINEMEYWVQYFLNIFGGDLYQELKPGDMATEYSGLLLKLIGTPNKAIFNVFVEPQNKARRSQVQEYLENYYGSGVQHMAFATKDIFVAMEHLRTGGVDFVTYPKAYYDLLREEGKIEAGLIDRLQENNVLCDVQEDVNGGPCHLFQTFTKPFGDRPTFFYEVIQRTGSYVGFALDNISQLFRAVEKEQLKREIP